MKTTSYSRVLEQAKRLAHRSGTVPAEESAALQVHLGVALAEAWTSRWWPELAVIEEVTPTSQLIDRRIGDADEIGTIIGVYSADPRTASNWKLYAFAEHGDDVVVHTTAETVWLEYMPPATALDDMTAEELESATVPDLFASAIAKQAAGQLLLGDGLQEEGWAKINSGKKDLEELVLQLNFPRWWTRIVVNHCM